MGMGRRTRDFNDPLTLDHKKPKRLPTSQLQADCRPEFLRLSQTNPIADRSLPTECQIKWFMKTRGRNHRNL